jgi:hypothetical protein
VAGHKDRDFRVPDGVGEFVADLAQIEQLDDDLVPVRQLDLLRFAEVEINGPQTWRSSRLGRLSRQRDGQTEK